MAGRIYLLNGNKDLLAMDEAPYDSERLLQEMLADHPDLLAAYHHWDVSPIVVDE